MDRLEQEEQDAAPGPRPALITLEMLADEPAAPPADDRLDFERGMRRLPVLTALVIAACVGAFALELAGGALRDEASIIRAGALTRAGLQAGELWRIFSAMFLHGGVEHLLGNCLVLYIVGMACEHAYGWAGMFAIYALSGVAGALLSALMNPGPSVGASGAIFGVVAAVIVFLFRHQKRFFLRDKRIGLVLLIWGAYQIATGFLNPMIDNFCHIGGALGGALAALAFRPRLLRRADSSARAHSSS